MSENDYLKIKLQLLQFQVDAQQAQLARAQALSDLRQLLGYESVPPDYDVAGPSSYQPAGASLEGLLKLADEKRPDLLAAKQVVSAAKSQHALAIANGTQDLTVSANYARPSLTGGGPNMASVGVSIPLAIFDRNQGEIARTRIAVTQAEHQRAEVAGQVRTDVRDAYRGPAAERPDRAVLPIRVSRCLARGAATSANTRTSAARAACFDFLDAERSYRTTQLGWRQAVAAYLMSLEQVRQAVGARSLQ